MKGKGVEAYYKESPEARLWRRANYVENEIARLKKEKKALKERDAPEAQIKRKDEAIKEKMDATGKVSTAHRELEERKKKKDSLKDKAGVEVPSNLRDYFGDMWIRDVADVFSVTIQSLENAARRCQTKGPLLQWMRTSDLLLHVKDAMNSLELAKETMMAGKPDYVCDNCKGKGFIAGSEQCVDCHGCGWLPEYRHEELAAE